MLHEALQIIHTTNKMQTKKLKQQPQRQQSVVEPKGPKVSLQKMYQSAPQFKSLGFGSSVAIHKLRETKWFKHNECKILLSVVESGFILERRCSTQLENRDWGIALWKPGQEKSKNIDHITIYCLVTEKDKKKVTTLSLTEFWLPENEIKINNLNDKEKTPNNEEDIRKQIEAALKNRNMKWHNSQHFPYWCRYDKPTLGRIQQISDRVKMNSIGVSFGMLIMKTKNRRTTTT